VLAFHSSPYPTGTQRKDKGFKNSSLIQLKNKKEKKIFFIKKLFGATKKREGKSNYSMRKVKNVANPRDKTVAFL
jgi:hypothetical protein